MDGPLAYSIAQFLLAFTQLLCRYHIANWLQVRAEQSKAFTYSYEDGSNIDKYVSIFDALKVH